MELSATRIRLGCCTANATLVPGEIADGFGQRAAHRIARIHHHPHHVVGLPGTHFKHQPSPLSQTLARIPDNGAIRRQTVGAAIKRGNGIMVPHLPRQSGNVVRGNVRRVRNDQVKLSFDRVGPGRLHELCTPANPVGHRIAARGRKALRR